MQIKPKQSYLKGKSVFIVSLLVVGLTVLIVYFSGINYNRALTTNLYASLAIIGTALFLFLIYGLYKGVDVVDDFPNYRNFKSGEFYSADLPLDVEIPDADAGDGCEGIVMAILMWIAVTVALFMFLILLEVVFWVSFFVIILMLYWLFFRALKLVFSKSKETQGNIGASVLYAFGYTVLYTGWIFGIVYFSEILGNSF